ncbi:MFS transporter [Brevibacterium luteolum]|uniref:MFS transporter n=1 Tax=Brevibacterium luteolum TaxID=199591 RepID=UPI001C23676F|nr:MFS transporter [Brevibacterium luteolum]
MGLPAIQADLGLGVSTLPWVVNSYILVFGALLLLGGRAGDIFGRKRVLQIGLVVFVVGALIGGLGDGAVLVIAGRAIQGLGAALITPNALALITSTFAPGKTRNLALGLYAAMAGVGLADGLLLSGVLTGALGWRWLFFFNIPIALLLLLGTRRLVEAERHAGRLTAVSAALGTGAMASLVYAITRGGEHGWTDPATLGFLGAAVVLLAVFLFAQSRAKDPMLPLHLFKNRNRSGAYLGMVLFASGPLGMFYLLNLYMQYVLDYSPMRTGLSWLPFAVGILVGAILSSKLIAALAPRVIIGIGATVMALGLLALSMVGTDTSYWLHLLPAIFATGLGFSLNFVPLTSAAVESVEQQNAGIASALLNTSQQTGAALGMAVFSSIAVAVTTSRLPDALGALADGRRTGDSALVAEASNALVDGYTSGLLAGAIIVAVAAVLTVVIINAKRPAASVEGPN